MSLNKAIIQKYNKLNEKSLKGEILLACRKQHVEEIAKQIIERELISSEFIDENIRLDNMKKKKVIIINDELRFQYINKLLQGECSKMTARLINELVET